MLGRYFCTILESDILPLEHRRFYTAYEFSKRRFAKKYGEQLPVWTLLASGATGGVGFCAGTRFVGI